MAAMSPLQVNHAIGNRSTKHINRRLERKTEGAFFPIVCITSIFFAKHVQGSSDKIWRTRRENALRRVREAGGDRERQDTVSQQMV